MQIREIQGRLDAAVITGGQNMDLDAGEVYIGDLLSHVMGKLPESGVWLTVMNNINVAAVASLAGAACVVLCDGVLPDDALKNKATAIGLTVITTKKDLFHAAKALLQ